MMDNFILRYSGSGAAPEADLARIRSAPGVTILDGDSPRMLLVQASADAIRRLSEALPGWVHVLERTIPLPDPRPKLRSN